MRKKPIHLGMVVCTAVLSVSACIISLGKDAPLHPEVFGIPLAGRISEVSLPEHTYTEPLPMPEIPQVTEAAQEASRLPSLDWDAEESYLLAKIAMAEAEGEDTEGKALVMMVVLNRVWDDSFPDSIAEVIYQSGQFSPVFNGRFDRVEPNEDCWAALDLIMLDKWDESQGALYFESESASTWHRDNLKYLFQHGAHIFYTDKEG